MSHRGAGRCRQPGKVAGLLRSRREPLEIRRDEHRIEHQPLDREAWGHLSAIPAPGFADDVVQRFGMDVVKPRAVVDALAGVRIATPDKLVEEGIALRPVRDSGNARILPRDAHAGVPHHKYQEARLTLAEAEFGDGLDAIVGRHHRQNSSAKPPWRPPPLPPPLRPLMRRLMPR